MPRWRQCGTGQGLPCDLPSGQPYRRPACAPHGHDRRLDRQQRSGRRLSGRAAGAGRDHRHQQREIAADDFFTGLFETALDEGEIVTAVKFTAPDQCGYSKFPNPASRYALTGVFVAKTAATCAWR
jgi:hypothetical protein